MQTDPPIVELALSLGFHSMQGFTIVDVADLYREYFQASYPIFQQAPPLPPMSVGPIHPGAFFGPTPVEFPRLWFLSEDTHFLTQLQHDRLAQNWRRIGPLEERHEYPGYEAVKARLIDGHKRFTDWLKSRGLSLAPLFAGELTYVNQVPLLDGDQEVRLGDVVTWYKGSDQGARVIGFQSAWWEAVEAIDGFINHTTQIMALPDGRPAIGITLTGQLPLDGVGIEDALVRFDVMHEKIHEVFRRVLAPKYVERARA